MSKEEVNPGEDCPFCLTATKPGSSVCTSCGANRVFDVTSKNVVAVTALNLFVKIAAVIMVLVGAGMISSNYNVLALFVFAGMILMVVGADRFSKSCSEYMWQRKE